MAKDFKIIPSVERSETSTTLYKNPNTVAGKLSGVLGSVENVRNEAKKTLEHMAMDDLPELFGARLATQVKVIRSCEWIMDIISGVDFPAELTCDVEAMEHASGEIMLRVSIQAITEDRKFITVMGLAVSIYNTKSDGSSYNPEDVKYLLRVPPAKFVSMDATLHQAPNWRSIKVLLDNMYKKLTQNGSFNNGHLDDLGEDYYITYGNTIFSSDEDLFLGLHLNPSVYTIKPHRPTPSTY